jgi:peptide/nickel transport system permease protein
MFSHFIQRIFIAFVTLIGTSLVIFMILAIAPGDPLGELASNPAITVAVRENIRRSLGLDQPIPIRYFKWLIYSNVDTIIAFIVM